MPLVTTLNCQSFLYFPPFAKFSQPPYCNCVYNIKDKNNRLYVFFNLF